MARPKARASARSATSAKKKRRFSWAGGLSSLRDLWLWPPLALWSFAQLEPYVWLGALSAEIYLQLGLASLLAALVALVRRRWLRGGAWLLGALLFLAPSWPFLRPARRIPEQGALLHVVQAHLAESSLERARLLPWLRRANADVLSLTGLSAASLAELEQPLSGYTTAARPRATRALLLVRSKLLPQPVASASVKLRVGRCDVGLTQVQLPSLSARDQQATRARQLHVLAAAPKKQRSLYLGHLGSRSAAHDLRSWLSAQGLRDARLGHGMLATSPAALGELGLAVDHVLVHGWIGVRSAHTTEPLVTGAHRTLHATLELTEPRCR